MQKTILSKITAIVLLIILIFPVFANTIYAVTEEVQAINENIRTSTRFVDASLTFLRGEETFEEIVADVNNTDLKFRLFLNLKDEGYFQGGQIEIRNPENLTYEFVQPEKKSDFIQSVEGQIIKLNQIKGVSETYLEVPIRYVGVDNVNSKDLINVKDFELTGEYTNAQGKKYNVYKRTSLTLNWIDSKEIEIDSKVQKFIKHEFNNSKSIVLQNLITVSNKEKEIILPTKSITVETNLLKLENKLPKSVNVSVQKAGLLNELGKIVLNKELYTWDENKNLLKIEVESVPNLDKTYSAGTGTLELLITSIYDVETFLDKYEGDMNIQVKQFVLSGDSKLTQINKDLNTKILIEKEIGELISVNEDVNVKKLPKGILYVNTLAEIPNDNIVNSKIALDISNVNLVDSIRVYEREPQYNNRLKERNLVYKTIEINKKEFENIFGAEGYIDIYSNDKHIFRLNNKTVVKDQNLSFNFEDQISNINIYTSKPIKEGELFINITKNLSKPSYNINTLKNIKSLDIERQAYIVYNNEQKLLNKIDHSIILVDASSNILVNTNRKELSTIQKNENVEFVIALNNDKLLSDVYGQTVLEMLLPQGIKDVNLKSVNIIHGNGLKISTKRLVKIGSQYAIQIVLSGVQNGLSTGHLNNGTNIIINTDITLDQWSESKDLKYNVTYCNTLATNYARKINWNMSSTFVNFKEYGNGIVQGDIKFVAPEGLVLVNSFSKYNKKNETVFSINQGYREGKLDILSGRRNISGNIHLLNNRGEDVTEPVILGRIPNKLNNDIFTNKTLGTTFDTILTEKLTTSNNKVQIYYSANPNATNDLRNVNNAWNKTMDLKDVKSYLVVLGEKLEKGKSIELNYSIEIPANLEHNNKIQTYSMVEYGLDTPQGNVRYYQMASPVGLSTGEGVELDINIKSDKEKIRENENITYTLEISNKAETTDAKNVESYFRIPDNLKFEGIKDDATNTKIRLSEDKKGVYLSMGDIKVGSSTTKNLVFTAKPVEKDEPIELIVNTTAENFELVKSQKTLGEEIIEQKMTVSVENTEDKDDITRVNIYPYKVKDYKITIQSNVDHVFNPASPKFAQIDITKVKIIIPTEIEFVNATPGYRSDKYIVDNIYSDYLNNRQVTVLELSLIERVLLNKAYTEFILPLKLSNSLPNVYASPFVVDVRVYGIMKVENFESGKLEEENIEASDVLVNYIAEVKLNEDYSEIYDLENYNNGEELKSIEEYQDILIKYSINPTYSIPYGEFIIKVPNGLKLRSIYKNATYADVKTASVLGRIPSSDITTYKYPFYIQANEKIDFFVHLHVESIGQASEKTLSYQVGIDEGKLESVNLKIVKGDIQNAINFLVSEKNIKLSQEQIKFFGLGASKGSVATSSITGTTWLDNKTTGSQINNKKLSKVTVELVDNETKKVVARTISDENGKYQFDNVLNGNYTAVFKYNNKYTPTAYNIKDKTLNSTGISANFNENIKTNTAITDGINVRFASVNNIDLGLIEVSDFDLSINSEITEIEVVNNDGKVRNLNFNDKKTVKLELDSKTLDNADINIKYVVRVKNEGKLEGNVLKVKAYIPADMKFDKRLNSLWQMDSEGNLFTTSISAVEIKPNQILQIPLILTKEFNKKGLGLSVVGFEIAETKNNLGLLDRDSTPNNKNTEEDDYINVDLILGLNTGKKIAYTLLILTTLLTIGTTIFLVLRKINGKEIK